MILAAQNCGNWVQFLILTSKDFVCYNWCQMFVTKLIPLLSGHWPHGHCTFWALACTFSLLNCSVNLVDVSQVNLVLVS